MPSVADLVEEPALRRLTTSEAFREGMALADGGRVHLGIFGPLRVTAELDGGAPCEVELRSAQAGLEWSCECDAGQVATLCSHAVATAIETWHRSPVRL
jgi:uncharacterized Zn finger protein